jgi:mono/diheme cytochrome c family protein
MQPRVLLALCVLGSFAVFCVPGNAEPQPPAKPAPVDYNRDVRPILAKNCFACHGPDVGQRAAGLRLDVRDAAVKERRHGAAIVPSKPDRSALVARLTTKDETERMPPKETGNHLSDEQVATLKRWIAEGAVYAEHWAWVKPTRPTPPPVANAAWVRNAVDAFVLARLEKAGLRPAEEADKYTLLRRVSLDLRGLPPTPREVEEFAKDTSPDAYEKAVDRFLQDPAYGERWARMWLDLARYADSAGYGSDPLRQNIWPYRDWVIDAFNCNLPFDQFTVEQIAGDLLPNATLKQKMATAFHRNTMTNTEGGTDDEEFRVVAVKDRVDTTLQVWMGLTAGCAKCHSHKYDPITQKEYYQLYAFFNQTMDNDQPSEAPTLAVPTPMMEEQNKQIDAQLAELRKKLDTPTQELATAQAKWEAGLRASSEWVALEPTETKTESGATLKVQPDKSLKAEGKESATDVYTVTARADLKGITAFRLEAIPDATLPAGGAGRSADGNFVLSRLAVTAEPDGQKGPTAPAARFVRVELPGKERILSLAEVQVFSKGENVARGGEVKQSSTAFEGDAKRAIDGNTNGVYYEANSVTHTATEANPWWEVKLTKIAPVDQLVVWNRTDGNVGVRLDGFRIQLLDESRKVLWQEEVKKAPASKREFSPSGRLSVTLTQATADHSQQNFPVAAAVSQSDLTKSGWAVAPQIKQPHTAVFVASSPLAVSPAVLTFRLEHRYPGGYTLGRFRLSITADPKALERAKVSAEVLAILDIAAEKRMKEQQDKLAAHYRSVAPELKPVRDEMEKVEKSRIKPPALPVMQELSEKQRRVTKLMIKGNFLNTGDKVDAAVPAAFHSMPKDAAHDRLGLARWLISPDNPLTARVAVNRFWAQLWGTGLVETEEDFGTQGELPTHPDLLDWLATEYVRLGWDTKAFLKLLVTSATYRQSSKVSPEALAKDPKNRLFTRAPRFRLEAEMVRDQALALSGLLSRKVGGKSVYPPQPPGLWQAAFNGERTWPTSTGADRYRRGLYTFWRRTIPYPSMATFDAPSRETCAVRRVRTNTPLQAFVTLNDPVYVEAAQALARRIMKEGGATAEERAKFALSLVLCRPAGPEQVKHVVELYESEREHYRKDAKAAEKLATDPLGPLPAGLDAAEAAAWTVVANILLNLDGVLTRG